MKALPFGVEAHFAGEVGCTPIEPSCPEGPLAEDVPIILVQRGGMGDGSSPATPLGPVDDLPFDALIREAAFPSPPPAQTMGTNDDGR
jgi:hypothetical protein